MDTSPDDPLEWVRRLDHVYLHPLGTAEGHVTACTGIVDRGTNTATIVSAGHPWPVLLAEVPRLIEMHPGQPMGLLPEAASSWSATTVQLQPGEGLLVYTDGLVEARVTPGSSQRRGHGELLDNAARVHGSPTGDVVDRLIDAMTTEGSGGFEDDVAVLAIRPVLAPDLAEGARSAAR